MNSPGNLFQILFKGEAELRGARVTGVRLGNSTGALAPSWIALLLRANKQRPHATMPLSLIDITSWKGCQNDPRI